MVKPGNVSVRFHSASVCNTVYLQILEANAKEKRKTWRESIGWNKMEPLQQKRAKDSNEYKLLPHGQYDEKKNELKHGPRHIHPNIIHYDLLDIYDSGAKDYDAKLNKEIPTILQSVDGYKKK